MLPASLGIPTVISIPTCRERNLKRVRDFLVGATFTVALIYYNNNPVSETDLTLISLLKGERLVVNKTKDESLLTEHYHKNIMFNKPPLLISCLCHFVRREKSFLNYDVIIVFFLLQ